jgi:hypothetical protein
MPSITVFYILFYDLTVGASSSYYFTDKLYAHLYVLLFPWSYITEARTSCRLNFFFVSVGLPPTLPLPSSTCNPNQVTNDSHDESLKWIENLVYNTAIPRESEVGTAQSNFVGRHSKNMGIGRTEDSS